MLECHAQFGGFFVCLFFIIIVKILSVSLLWLFGLPSQCAEFPFKFVYIFHYLTVKNNNAIVEYFVFL